MRRQCSHCELSCLVLAVALVLTVGPLSAEEIHWLDSWDQAVAEAKSVDKPLLMDFWAAWCQPCRVMDEQLWETERVVGMSDDFVFVRIDVDVAGKIQRKYRVGVIPTMLIADAYGTELVRTEGFDGPEPYAQLVEIVHAAYPDIRQWSGHLQTDPKHTEALRQIGRAFNRQRLYTVSNDFFERALKSPGAKEDKTVQVDLLTAIGWNELHIAGMLGNEGDASRAYGKAVRTFRKSMRLDIDSERHDVALFGLVMCHAKRREFKDAEDCLRELEESFPESPATAQARRFMQKG